MVENVIYLGSTFVQVTFFPTVADFLAPDGVTYVSNAGQDLGKSYAAPSRGLTLDLNQVLWLTLGLHHVATIVA